MNDTDYLVEHDPQDREKEAVRRLLLVPPLRIFPEFTWAIVELPLQSITTNVRGEVDVLTGNLQWEEPEEFSREIRRQAERRPEFHSSQHRLLAAKTLAEGGGIVWPPKLDLLEALEAKLCYLPEDRLDNINSKAFKSSKDSDKKLQKLHREVDRLIDLGCNRVAILDLIANPPTDDWFTALAVLEKTAIARQPQITARFHSDGRVGHILWSIGAVAGGDERYRGAGGPRQIRQAKLFDVSENADRIAARKVMQKALHEFFRALPKPTVFPCNFRFDQTTKKLEQL